jgi:hypothetical protein
VPPGYQIDHADTNKQKNRIDNLEAVTGVVNMKRAAAAGLCKGGRTDGIRDGKGRFGKKRAGRLLDGDQHDGYPA